MGGGVGGDERFFGFRGDDLNVDVVGASEEEALADREVGETLLFFVSELEYVGEDVDGGSGLFEKKLHGRVGDDGTAHLGGHEIFDVLSDGGEAKVVFAGALGKREEEVSGVFKLHELPGLIDDEEATLLFGADDVPNVREDDIHGDRAKLVFEVANVEDDHLIVNVYIALL